ncbi:hypothetical protein TrLO_g4603 [Triparma laevis f. longispina]|uniref:C-type lectin domain-containing protein n=1 Tax=Triparma laevis f. longispina TaxID=1714387 RepID=A0A9W7FTU9_9STRA|nr:hypothetical protein TrLO_g4603 [Triparma laevis f. longispina]
MDPLSSALDDTDDLDLDNSDKTTTRSTFIQNMNAALGLSSSSRPPISSSGADSGTDYNPLPSTDYGVPNAYSSNPPEQGCFERFVNHTTMCAVFFVDLIRRNPKLTAKVAGVITGVILLIVLISGHGHGVPKSAPVPIPTPPAPAPVIPNATTPSPVPPPAPNATTPSPVPPPAPNATTPSPIPAPQPNATTPSPVPAPPVPPPSIPCTQNLTFGDPLHPYQNSIYQVGGSSNSDINWFDAKLYAEMRCWMGKRGRLVSVDSQEEQDFLQTLVQSHPSYYADGHMSAWTGGFIPTPNSTYHWSPTRPLSTFTNWCPNEPNNSNGGTEQCMNMHVHGTGCWNDRSCYDTAEFFIVEYD